MTYIYHKLISPKVGYILAQNHVGNELLGSPCALVGETYQEPSKMHAVLEKHNVTVNWRGKTDFL